MAHTKCLSKTRSINTQIDYNVFPNPYSESRGYKKKFIVKKVIHLQVYRRGISKNAAHLYGLSNLNNKGHQSGVPIWNRQIIQFTYTMD